MHSIYNSLNYWEKKFRANKTIKAKIFNDEELTHKTVYLHYVVFNRKSGIESVWMPLPNVTSLLGFIQYCFLPEAFYKWFEGKDSVVKKIPDLSVDTIVSLAASSGKVDKDEIQQMKKQVAEIKAMWKLPSKDLMRKIKVFAKEFNRKWIGNNSEFLYLNVYKNSEELGNFVVNTNIQTDFSKSFEEKIGLSESEWLDLCKNPLKDKSTQEKFKNILYKHLSDVV
ncbi:hypothetical protein SAMN02745163_02487 [Clostridium cavendishii DSM 21758]|uniref:Uncharacterized protein n=1 Tax=Clostridium cavendishii DSM 21758 TaxID=1121302 RepID=A0A1M6LT90_9CLOT|nr:hypothetical protein [Clostridium cavendishii]SHJ74409.1 hypothetical protein SAMN02745163_02487 [Clostridium cavendishii DSM 21758]